MFIITLARGQKSQGTWGFIKEKWMRQKRVSVSNCPFRSRVTDEDDWGGADLSGSKLENFDPTCVRPSRIGPSRIGTDGSRAGPNGLRGRDEPDFFFNLTKKQKIVKNSKNSRFF
jgi:hypothetical protein